MHGLYKKMCLAYLFNVSHASVRETPSTKGFFGM